MFLCAINHRNKVGIKTACNIIFMFYYATVAEEKNNMFNNKHFSNFLKLCSVLPAIMPAMAETSNPVDVALGGDSAAYTGPTITLTENIAQAKGHSVKGGSDLTIDFAGHTYSAYGEPAGSDSTKNQLFQFLAGSEITLKDGTLNVSENATDQFRFLIQNYSGLTLDNMTLKV